jgi:hypothetical protein
MADEPKTPEEVAREVMAALEDVQMLEVIRAADQKTEADLQDDPPVGPDGATWRPGR